ncbi:MAG TPA: SDR family oxidoreductase [Candidatus Paceibacterota bacterium]
MKKRLEGKTVIVVGATGGIGRVLSRVFHQLGANVVLAARGMDKLKLLEGELSSDRVLVVQADATQISDVRRLFQLAQDRFKEVHCVVISAGTWERLSLRNSVEEALESAEKLFRSIFLPSYVVGFMAQEFFRRQGFGLIANISSHAAIRPWLLGNLSYAAMKAAARQFILALRHELREMGVTVIDIQPAIVNTPEAADLLNTEVKKRKAVQPELIADLIASLIGRKRVPAEVLLDSKLKL